MAEEKSMMNEKDINTLTTVLCENNMIDISNEKMIASSEYLKYLGRKTIIDVLQYDFSDENKNKMMDCLRDHILSMLNDAAQTKFNSYEFCVEELDEYFICKNERLDDYSDSIKSEFKVPFCINIPKLIPNLKELKKLNEYLSKNFKCYLCLRDDLGWVSDNDLECLVSFGDGCDSQISHWGVKECDDDYINPTLGNIINNLTSWSPIPVFHKNNRGVNLFIPRAV